MFRRTNSLSITLPITLAILLAVSPTSTLMASDSRASTEPVVPAYDEEGRLKIPDDFPQWVLAGTSFALSYSDAPLGHDMFHHTLIEPTAYAHFRETGEFREGTMFALLLHGIGEGALPSRQGTYASELHTVEMAVKDKTRDEQGWSYYNFGSPSGLLDSASAMPAASCQSCHVEHAAYDNVFLQFYPLLVDAAPEGVLPAGLPGALRVAPSGPAAAGSVAVDEEETSPSPLALAGLDPVLLTSGREELGKPEIVMEHDGLRYQFLSEPTRERFEQDPERYSIQNETCVVVPGAPIDPSLYAVHEEKIYAFATPGCVATFEGDPSSYALDDR